MSTTDLVEIVEERPPVTLFGTVNPAATLERMAEYAAALVDVVRQRRLSVRIQGRDI